jgi:hypothetical protein
LKDFERTLPKGLKTTIMYNSKEFLDASIDQVTETLVIAFILVFLVVFLFLQDFRSTVDPGHSRSGGYYRHLLLHAAIRLYHQPAHPVCPGAGYWCGGR